MRSRPLVHRHPLSIRLAHWINVIALTALLSSGLGIFNAHPALYWGHSSYGSKPAWLEMSARQSDRGAWVGITRVSSYELDTTGVLGLSNNARGELEARGFPWWATTPSGLWLAMSRAWHFFFAWILVLNGLFYLGYSVVSGHLRRDLLASGPASDRERGETHYGTPQRIAYLVAIFVIVPLCVTTGLAMSPWLDASLPGFVDFFGGHQSARSFHFIGACLLTGFVAIHVGALIVDKPWNRLRSMITGRYEPSEPPLRSRHD